MAFGWAAIPKSVHTEDYKLFLSLLRNARVEAGLNQRELAKRLAVGQSVISKCESGERQLNIVELRDWCVKGLGLDWLAFLAEFEIAAQKHDDSSSQP